MITFNIGKEISDIVISTAFGHGGDGLFPYTLWPAYRRLIKTAKRCHTTIIAKSATAYERIGNFRMANPLTWKFIQRLPDRGMLNAYGLTNDGAFSCAQEINRVVKKESLRVIPNFYPEFAKGLRKAVMQTIYAISLYKSTLGDDFWVIELNFSCPNSQEAIAENMLQAIHLTKAIKREYPRLRIIAKISVVHPLSFTKELGEVGTDVIHAVNTVPFNLIFPDRKSPLEKVGGGGVSGGPAFISAFRRNEQLRKETKLPLIMGCGVSKAEDVKKYFSIGADAVSICSLAVISPSECADIINQYQH